MDADAYLRKQGWKGSGHSLDHQGRGIRKPLLIAHKQDQLGLGKKKAAHTVDDQWWMRAFDESLQNIGTGQESTLSQVRTKGINRGGLYGFFVRGEGLVGTISSTEESSTAEASNSSVPPSGASTPPTSASDSDSPSESSNDGGSPTEPQEMSKKNNKRKRDSGGKDKPSKKLKQEPEANGAKEAQSAVGLPQMTFFGPLDLDQIAKINTAMRTISRQVKTHIAANAKKGVYGLYIPAKAIEGRQKGEAHQLFDDPNNPGKKMTYKTAKFQREKAMRDAKSDVTKEFVVAAMMKGDLPNPERWSEEKASANYKRIEGALLDIEKAEKRINKGAKEQKKEARKVAVIEQRRLAKEQREAEKKATVEGELAKAREVVATKLDKLTPEKVAEYEHRAAEKNQTLEDYIFRRMEKKDSKRAARDAEKEAKKQPGATSDVLFFTDVDGDANLLNDGLRAAAALEPPQYEPLSDGSCPLDPSIWEGRIVKTLPKPVREARRKHLENLRAERKIRAGKPIDQGPSRAQKKHKAIQIMMKDILSEQGIKKRATKEQKDSARKAAKKVLKIEKREEKYKGRDKLMHNKKNRHRVSERAKKRNEDAKKAAVIAAA